MRREEEISTTEVLSSLENMLKNINLENAQQDIEEFRG